MLPLVSITIHNYNYGRYLKQCLRSVDRQTYPNIEVIFADNASDDDSWKIAQDYAAAHPGQCTLIKQRFNRGSGYNSATCWRFVAGKYFTMLCSDDAIEPTFIEKVVGAMEAHPTAGLAFVHRSILDAKGKRTEEPPFYNRSCFIPGEAQAAVYMMTSCTPSISQVVYHHERWRATGDPSKIFDLAAKWFGTRMNDFNICLQHDAVYIHEPLLLHRVHGESDSAGMVDNMVELVGQYLLPYHFAGLAEAYGLQSVAERLPAACVKTAENCVRYATRAAQKLVEQGNADPNHPTILRLLHLAQAFDPTLTLAGITRISGAELDGGRQKSYDPPEGSIDL